MKDRETYDLIESYLNNTLSSNEKAAFEALQQNDAAFSEEVTAHRIANEIIIDNALLDIKQQLKQIHIDKTIEKDKGSRRFWFGLVVVTLISLVTAWVFLFPDKEEASADKVASQVDTTVPYPQSTTGIPDTLAIKTISEQQKGIEVNQERIPHEVPAQQKAIPVKPEAILSDVIAPNKEQTHRITEEAILAKTSNIQQNAADEEPEIQPSEDILLLECEGVNMRPQYSIAGACKGQRNGAIIFETPLFEGTPPFMYSIDGGDTFFPTGQFENHAIGKYNLLIKDSKGCKSDSTEVYVEKKICSFIIYPYQQKYWKTPLKSFAGEQVTLRILNARTGQVVYQKSLSSTEDHIWNGTGQDNRQLTMGSYVYTITSKESSKTESGQITIIQ